VRCDLRPDAGVRTSVAAKKFESVKLDDLQIVHIEQEIEVIY
jgi:hypothetical protein